MHHERVVPIFSIFCKGVEIFLLTMLRLMKERDILNVINDQYDTPNWSRLIIKGRVHIIKQAISERKKWNLSPAFII
jgi:dTDP-4-dehydrorhamnose reductase